MIARKDDDDDEEEDDEVIYTEDVVVTGKSIEREKEEYGMEDE